MGHSLRVPEYFHREYNADLPDFKGSSKTDLLFRVTKAALPIISLNPEAGKALAITASLLRLGTSLVELKHSFDIASILDTALSIAAVAGSIFLHPVGMLITTSHDLLVNVYAVYLFTREGRNLEAFKQLTQLVNNTLYLMTMFSISLELQVASLAVQVLVGTISSVDEFSKGRWIEGCSNAVMTAFRINQLVPQVKLLQKKWEIEAAVKNFHVGSPHELWRFPSDHLPVGVEVDGVEMVSWNVLNDAYMDWVKNDSQGLKDSLISEMHVPIKENGLTKRDVYVADMIKSMTPSKGLIALQECGQPFLEHLRENLPANWKIIPTKSGNFLDQDVILYNTNKLIYRPEGSEISYDCYSNQKRAVQNIAFEKVELSEKFLRIFNVHIPGDPALPARDEFAQYVYNHSHSPQETVIALGDNNFEHHEMYEAYRKVGFRNFELHAPWHTNIDPYTKNSKSIDPIFIFNGEGRDLRPDEVLGPDSRLQETIDLLRKG